MKFTELRLFQGMADTILWMKMITASCINVVTCSYVLKINITVNIKHITSLTWSRTSNTAGVCTMVFVSKSGKIPHHHVEANSHVPL
jgi:hypothetical protein